MVKLEYQQLEKRYESEELAFTKKVNTIAYLRLFSMISLLFCVYQYYQSQAVLYLFLGLIFLVAFLKLLSLHLNFKQKAQLFGLLKTINANEIKYLNGDLTPFKMGKEYIETDHPFTYDLDIFGETSIFQHINRTTTPLGEEQLAIWLRNSTNIDIKKQQEAVRELALKRDWRQHYLASGQLFIDEKTSLNAFRNWLNLPLNYQKMGILKIGSFILPIITLAIVVANFVSDDPIFWSIFKVLFFSNLFIVASQKKTHYRRTRIAYGSR
jgi:hypothetical protein